MGPSIPMATAEFISATATMTWNTESFGKRPPPPPPTPPPHPTNPPTPPKQNPHNQDVTQRQKYRLEWTSITKMKTDSTTVLKQPPNKPKNTKTTPQPTTQNNQNKLTPQHPPRHSFGNLELLKADHARMHRRERAGGYEIRNDIEHKPCRECKEVLPLTDFYRKPSGKTNNDSRMQALAGASLAPLNTKIKNTTLKTIERKRRTGE